MLPLAARAGLGFALAGALALGAAPAQADAPAPFAGLASLIVPGLGQASNGDYASAAAHFGVYATAVLAGEHYRRQRDFLPDDTRYGTVPDGELVNRTMLRYDYATRLATDTALYSSYAAYRDARLRDNRGYRTPPPGESLDDLALAPFSLELLSRPTTFVPLALQAWAASRGGYGIYRSPDVGAGSLYAYHLLANEATAVGEEALFRGVFNNELSDRYGPGWGLALSSLTFGVAHNGQGQTASIAQAAAAGAYLGWLQQRNGYRAAEGVALHYWLNVLAGISAIRHGGGAALVALRIPF